MANSRVAASNIRCAACGADVPFEARILIDVDEHPDWLADLARDALNLTHCQACGTQLAADLPVILFFPGFHTPLLFSPALTTPEETNRRHAQMAETLARDQLREHWRPGWLRDGLMGVPRPGLKAMLSNGPGGLKQEFLELCRRHYLDQFLIAETAEEERALVEAHPELLDPAVDTILKSLVEEYWRTGRANLERLVRQERVLLARCREAGVGAAFEERGAGYNPHRTPEVEGVLLEWHRFLEGDRDRGQSELATGIELAGRLLAVADAEKDSFVVATAHGARGQFLLAIEGGDRETGIRDLESALENRLLLQRAPSLHAEWAAQLGRALAPWPPAGFEDRHARSMAYLEQAVERLDPERQGSLLSECRQALACLHGARLALAGPTASLFTHTLSESPDEVAAQPDPPAEAGRFSRDAPAADVRKLLAFLQSDSPERYVFRGQTRAYPFLIPSVFRRGAVSKAPLEGWVRVSSAAANGMMSRRQLVQARMRTRLLAILGKGIGNIVAQQYGLASEMLDMTEDPRIAAFFATREYPEYRQYGGTEANPLGVIYRLPRRDGLLDVSTLERTLHMVGMTFEPIHRVLWFARRVAIPALVSGAEVDQLKELERYFSEYGKAEADLMTQHTRITCSDLERIYPLLAGADGRPLPGLAASRLVRQRGGLSYPVIWHRCLVPANFQVNPSPWPREAFVSPDLIAIKDIMAVTDLLSASGCEAFFFKHGPAEITELDCPYLWPGPEEDSLLALVEEVAHEIASDYLAEICSDLYDPERGLVDRGYRLPS